MSARNDRNARASVTALTYTSPPDKGADGPAALARRLIQVPTDDAGVWCRQVVDRGPLAGRNLEPRQMDAASELARLWREALPGREAPMGYGGDGKSGRHLSPEEERAAGDAAREYLAGLDAVQWACGVRGVMVVESVVIHHGASQHLAHLAQALTALADHFEER